MNGVFEQKRRRIISEDGPATPDSEEESPLLRSTEFAAKLHRQSSKRYGTIFEDNLDRKSESSSVLGSLKSTTSSLSPVLPLSLTWHDLNVYVPAAKSLLSRCKKTTTSEHLENKKDGRKQILFGVDGHVKPGELVALMGASGAGKTTLLNVLTQRNIRSFTTEGSVRVNGEEIGRKMTSISAYVQQEDLLIGALTVREHLNFQALLRLPKTYTWRQKMIRAYEVLCELGLKTCEDTRIGIPSQEKGISGGEKKRLAFASEALTNPAVFFCDEPTTGLDSFMAEQVVLFLRKMAQHGKTVICTIHQPASEVYALFDSVYLLAEGRLTFYGTLPKALDFFTQQGFPCPKDYNPADFYIHTLAIVPGNESQCRERVMGIAESFATSHKAEMLAVESNTEESRKPSSVGDLSLPSGYRVSWLTQFFALLWRSTLYNYRTKRIAFVRIVQKVFMGLFVGLLYLETSASTQTGIADINGAMFFMLMQVSMPAVMGILRYLPDEFPILTREHHSGMYSVSGYYWSKGILHK